MTKNTEKNTDKTTTTVDESKGPNKATEKAGLVFNVNRVKASMQEYYKTQGHETPKFSGVQFATTAVVQKMFELLVRNVYKHTQKDKSGMRTATRSLLRQSVFTDPSFNNYYYMKLTHFDKTFEYSVPVDRKSLDAVVNTVDSQLCFTPKAWNLLYYLVYSVYVDVMSVAYQFVEYANRKSLDGRVVVYALKNCLSNSDVVCHDLCLEVQRVMKAVGDDVQLDEEDKTTMKATAEQPEDDSDNEEEQTTKQQPAKVAQKKPTAKAQAQKIEVEEDEENEEDEELGDDEEEEEEEEAKPAKRATKTTPATKAQPQSQPKAQPKTQKKATK